MELVYYSVTPKNLGYLRFVLYLCNLTTAMRAILLIMMLHFGMTAEANDNQRPLYRPSFGMLVGKDHSDNSKLYRFSSFSSHLQLEFAEIDRIQFSVGLFSFYKVHNYSYEHSGFSYNHSPWGSSSTTTNTTYNCKLKETTHNATIAAGWNSRCFNNRIHFEINLGMMLPFQEKYSVSEMNGNKKILHSSWNQLYGSSNSLQTESLVVTEEYLQIPKQNATRWSNYLSFQTSFLFRNYLELGAEIMLASLPIRAGIDYFSDNNTYYLIRNFGFRITYNL